MLYLEDFLELIENLPSELRDRFTEIRTLDLEVQNGLDVAEKGVEDLFKSASNISDEEQQRAFDKIKEDYRKILENADEKVNLATMMHDLVKRYLAKLDQEVNKFKIELEADNPGITEALERNVKEAEQMTRMPKKERSRKRKRTLPLVNGDVSHDLSGALLNSATVNGLSSGQSTDYQLANRHVSLFQGGDQTANSSPVNANFKKNINLPNRPTDVNKVQSTTAVHLNSSALSDKAAAGSTAASSGGGAGSGAGFLHSFSENTESRHGRPRKLTSRVSEMLRDVIQKQEQRERAGGVDGALAAASGLPSTSTGHQQVAQGQYFGQGGQHHHHGYQHNQQQYHLRQHQHHHSHIDSDVDGANNDAAELSDQSDQQRWCICNRVSFGNMVACDDKDCPFEWFHYECVGITQPPKGKWFCPHCTKRRK